MIAENGADSLTDSDRVANSSSHSQDKKEEIQQLLDKGFYSLKFPPPIETEFLKHYHLASRKIFTINSVYVVLIFVILGGILFYRLPTEEWGFLLHCYAIMALILAFLITISHMPKFDAYRDLYIGSCTYLGIVTVTMMVLGAESLDMLLAAHAGVSLSFIVVYTLARQRCYNAGVACCLAGITHLFIAMYFQYDLDLFRFQAYFTGPNLLGLAICYMLEHRERTLFLQGQLLALDRIEIEALNTKLAKLSQEDSLTGLANRRVFEESLRREWNRGLRQGQSLSIVFADVDFFKLYNDFYGHQAGDECLIQVAKILQAECSRATDLAARYGGEEFILLYAETNADQLMGILKRLHEKINAARIPHEQSEVAEHVTVSFGAVSLKPSGHGNEHEAIRMADNALYQAKTAGRNCWRIAKVSDAS